MRRSLAVGDAGLRGVYRYIGFLLKEIKNNLEARTSIFFMVCSNISHIRRIYDNI